MALVLGINSYVTVDEADEYFEDRLDVASWEGASDTMKEQAIVTATMYLDRLAYAGCTASATQALAWPRQGGASLPSRGRDLSFKKDYTWSEISCSVDQSFVEAFVALPYEIQLIKKATFEQAYHFVNNDGVLDSTGDSPDTITIGDISLSWDGNNAGTDKSYSLSKDIVKPLLQGGGRNTWYRAN